METNETRAAANPGVHGDAADHPDGAGLGDQRGRDGGLSPFVREMLKAARIPGGAPGSGCTVP